jgi:hypothetical protein
MRGRCGQAGQALHRTAEQEQLLLHQQHRDVKATQPKEDNMKNYGYEILCAIYCAAMIFTAALMMGV